MAQSVQNFCVSRKVFLKYQVNCNTDCGAIQDLHRQKIWAADNPVEVLNEHLLLLVGRFLPTKVISVASIIVLGLMINAGMILACIPHKILKSLISEYAYIILPKSTNNFNTSNIDIIKKTLNGSIQHKNSVLVTSTRAHTDMK